MLFEVEKSLVVNERVRLLNEWFETEEKAKYYIRRGKDPDGTIRWATAPHSYPPKQVT